MEVKKSDKANVQKSSMLYFLIGLNVVLFVVLLLFNYKHYDEGMVEVQDLADTPPPTEAVLIDIPLPKTPPPPPKPDDTPPPPPPPAVPTEIKQVDKPVPPPPIRSQDPAPPEIPTAVNTGKPVGTVDLSKLIKKANKGNTEERVVKPVTVNRVAEMAIYPGCEEYKGNKRELIKCFSKKFGEDILRYLDTEFPDVDKEYVSVKLEFHVNQDGYITNIDPKYGDDVFKPEAKRAVEKAAEYLRRKGEVIQPAKMDDGSKAILIFTQPVTLKNPNY